MKVDPARVDIGIMPLADIICAAFKLKPYQVGGPSWRDLGPAGGPRFDIHATFPEGASEKDVPELLQAVLVERFGLRFHRVENQLGPRRRGQGDSAGEGGRNCGILCTRGTQDGNAQSRDT